MIDVIKPFRPIRKRVLMWILFASTVTTTILTGFVLYYEYSGEVQSLDRKLDHIEQTSVRSLARSLWDVDDGQIRSQIEGILQLDDIVGVSILSTKGKELQGVAEVADIQLTDTRTYQLIHPGPNGPERLGTLEVTSSKENIFRRMKSKLWGIFITQMIKTLVISLVIILIVERLISLPLTRIVTAVRDHDPTGNEALQLPDFSAEKSSSELTELVSTLRSMDTEILDFRQSLELQISTIEATNRKLSSEIQQREEAEDQLIESQKMEALGKLAGGVAHDFNNLLVAIIGFSDLLIDDLDDPDLQGYAEEIQKAGYRAEQMTKQLLAFSRNHIVQTKPIDVGKTVEAMGSLLARLVSEDVTLNISSSPAAPHIVADETHIEQVVLNLVTNARDALPRGGTIDVQVRETLLEQGSSLLTADHQAGDYAEIKVADDGAGMPTDIAKQIFDPFFTTKDKGKGTGLGLSTVRAIVDRFGGWIRLTSEPDTGTEFRIFFPLTTEREAKEQARDMRADAQKASGTVLLAEDDRIVASIVTQILRDAGYTVHAASCGAEALVLAQTLADSSQIDILVTDVVMPGMQGPELAKELETRGFDIPVLFISGYTEHPALLDIPNQDDRELLHKPFSPTKLRDTVADLLSHSRSQLSEPRT